MITPRKGIQIFLYTQSVDFRKAINGLSAIVHDEFSNEGGFNQQVQQICYF